MADITNPGEVATQDIAEQQAYLHGLAMQALAKQYGPTVYAGEQAQQAQENYLNSQIDPLKIQAAQQGAAGATANIAKYGPQAANQETQGVAGAALQQQHDLARQHIGQLSAIADPTTGAIDATQAAKVIGDGSQYGLDPRLVPAVIAKLSQPANQGGGTALLNQIGQSLLPWQASAMTGGLHSVIDPKTGAVSFIGTTKGGQERIINAPSGTTTTQQENAVTNRSLVPAKNLTANAAAITAGVGGPGGIPTSSLPISLGQGLPQPTTNLINGPGNTTSSPAPYVGGTPAGQQNAAPVARKGTINVPLSDGSGYVNVPQGSAPKIGVGQQLVVDKTTGQLGVRTLQVMQNPQAIRMAGQDLAAIDLQYGRTNQVLDKAMSQVNNITTGWGGETIGRITPQKAALEASIQTAKSNIALLTANLARQSGGGRSVPVAVRNLQEFKAYQDALGAIDPAAPPDVVRGQITTAKNNLTALQNAVHGKYRAIYGDGIEGQLGWPQQTQGASQQPQFQHGKVYIDGAGNRAVYNNGQWVPVH